MSHKIVRLFFVVILMIGLLAIQSPQAVRAAGPWYVATTGNDSNSCTATGSPCLTINGALGKAAASGDTINVATGTYTGTGTEVVLIDKSVTLSGGWNASFTTQGGMSTIDGQVTRPGITVNNYTTVVIEHFIIQNGFSSSHGGGIKNGGGDLTLNNSNITNNTASLHGGGITFAGTLTLNNSTVSNNTASNGGGIWNLSGTLTLNNSTISGNIASGGGGGIDDSGGLTVLNNSTVSNNTSTNGGGIRSLNNLRLNSSTVSGNTATDMGGGLIGGGLTGLVTLQNSIVAGNAAGSGSPDCAGTISSAGYNLVGNNLGCTINATIGDLVGTSALPINPGLTPLQDNGGPTFTHALMAGSPAIDAGNPASPGSGGSACLATDQRGTSRPVSTACDIGTFEGQVPAILVNISGNAGVAGATLSYMEYIPKTVTTDGNGNYSISVLLGWSGTVTPSKAGYIFAPVNRTYSNYLVTNQTSQNYTPIAVFVISGNAGVAGATLSYTDGTPKTATADGSGNYSFAVPSGWSGVVTPSKAGYIFTPVNKAYNNVVTNQTSENYTATAFFIISGNAGVAGAILSYTDGTSKTAIADGNGNYSIQVLTGWSGTVTPSKAGYIFAPVNRTYSNVVIDQSLQNYTAATLIQDPSFEAFTPNPYWSEFSTNFGTPLCRVVNCGNGGGSAWPRTGVTWGWFGGVPTNETASLSQTITIPSGFPNLKLQFYFYIGAAYPGSDTADVFTAKVDGVTVFSVNATQSGSYVTYTPILADVSAFANDAPHTIAFSSVTTGQVVNFSLDDVALVDIPFFDVPSDYWALQFIGRLYNAGITGGCTTTPLNYCPDSTVTRAQMAIFLLKGMHGSNYAPPAVGASTGFTDVPAGYWAAAWIKQLAAEGITGGCGSGNYCPDATVTRAQMAVFLLKAKYGSGFTPPAVGTSTGFTDVATSYWAAAFIKQLVTEGITSGCAAGSYCPDSSVTRAQMAVFLVKTFGLP